MSIQFTSVAVALLWLAWPANLRAQDNTEPPALVIKASHGLQMAGGASYWDGEQWVTQPGTKVEGSLSLEVVTASGSTTYSYRVIGDRKISDGAQVYDVDNGKSFLLVDEKAHPARTEAKATLGEYATAAEAYAAKPTKETAWLIWEVIMAE